jgi:hypothetical protein
LRKYDIFNAYIQSWHRNNITFYAFLLYGSFIKRLDLLSLFLSQNIPTYWFLFNINLNVINILISFYVPFDGGSARYKSATYTGQPKHWGEIDIDIYRLTEGN